MLLLMFIQSGERVIILTTMNKSRRFFNKLSISVIIFLLLFLVGLGGCIFVSGNLYRTWRKEILNDSSVRLLKEHSEAIANRIHATEFTRKPDDDSVISELCDLALLFGGRAVVCNDELRVVYDTAQTDTGRYLLIDDAIRAIRGDTVHTVFEEAENGMLLIPIPGMERNASEGVLCYIFPMKEQMKQLHSVRNRVVSLCVIFSVFLVGFGILICTRISKPMNHLAKAMLNPSGSGQNDPIDVHVGYREIGEIMDNANHMISRLNEADKTRREFVSNVSHELKTPMSSIKVLADSLLMQDNSVSEETYREFLTDINEEIDRENLIINDLLTLVSMEGKENPLHLAKTHVNKLLEVVLNRVLPIAKDNNIEVIFDNYRDVYAEIDENRMIMSLTNIVENSVKYNRPGGSVRVSLNSDFNNFVVTIEDTGIGIPEDAIPHLFERFYRVDKARSRQTGGSGLGLSIAYEIVKSHGGEIRVSSKLNVGSVFRIRIPLSNNLQEEEGNAL